MGTCIIFIAIKRFRIASLINIDTRNARVQFSSVISKEEIAKNLR